MSGPRRTALVVIGLALVAALWVGGQSLVGQGPGAEAPRGIEPPQDGMQAAKPPSSGPNRTQGSEAPEIRRVAPGSIAEPNIAGPLERIAPRDPLTAATKPLKREPFGPAVPQGTTLYRPIATAAGKIEAGGYTIRLAGIKETPAGRTCLDEAGKRWPCGAVGRTAFRAWMRGRAVACDVPPKPTEITTHCTLDGEDMALWLVRNGWAESAGQYGDAQAEAKREKRGIFGRSPLETSPQ